MKKLNSKESFQAHLDTDGNHKLSFYMNSMLADNPLNDLDLTEYKELQEQINKSQNYHKQILEQIFREVTPEKSNNQQDWGNFPSVVGIRG